MRTSLILILLGSFITLKGQNSVANIIDFNKSEPFYLICAKIDSFFTHKYPNFTAKQLSTGNHRDGEYVKYKRWQNFWKTRLESDGRLADLASYNIKSGQDISLRGNSILDNLEWNNISYTEDLGVQIGLGRTNSLAFHPTDANTFYVGTALGGIWKTEDGGSSYVPLGEDLPFMAVSCIIVDQKNPETIYIAISDRVWYGPPSIGVYKSLNGGQSWSETALSFDFNENARIYWMEADPNNPDIILVGASNGLYRTEDGFDNFEKLSDNSICDIKYMPGSSQTIYYAANTFPGFFKSNDGGKNFSYKYATGSGWKRIMVTPLDTNKVYVCSAGEQELYISLDAAESLDSKKDISESEVSDGICMFSQLDESSIYAGWFDMYASVDTGDNFQKISDWLGRDSLQLIHVDQRNAFCNPLQPELIYLCNDGGVYSVNVTNNAFTNLSNGLQITHYYDIAVAQSDAEIMSGGSQDNGNVFMDGGVWTAAAPTADGMMQAIDPNNANLRYNSIQNGILFRYENETRANISDNLPIDLGEAEWVTPLLVDNTLPNNIYAAYQKVYASSDNGNTWSAISPNLAGNRPLDILAISPSNSERLYAVENYGPGTGNLYGTNHTRSTLYTLEDNGDWTSYNLPGSSNVEDIAVHPLNKDQLYITCGSYKDGEKIYESFDAGQTWTNISGTLPNVPATAIAYYESEDDYLFIGTDAGVYYTQVDSIEWLPVGDFPNTYITDIEIQKEEKLIRVGTHGRGILEGFIDLEQSNTINLSSVERCLDFSPNPVKDILTTSLQPHKTMEVINSSGELLWINKGPVVDMSQLPSGIYYLRVRKEKPCIVKIAKI